MRRTREFLIAPVAGGAARWGWAQLLDVRPVDDCPLCCRPLVPGDPEYRTCRCELGALLLREVR